MPVRHVRWVGIAGLAFVALLVVSIFVAPGTPQASASATKVLKYYHDHKTSVAVDAYLISAAVLVGVFFFWFLRDLVATVADNRRLSIIGFGGGLLFAASGLLAAGLYWAALNFKHLDAGTVQGINTLQQVGISFLLGTGQAILLIAMGVAIARSGPLPRWVGWPALVLAAM